MPLELVSVYKNTGLESVSPHSSTATEGLTDGDAHDAMTATAKMTIKCLFMVIMKWLMYFCDDNSDCKDKIYFFIFFFLVLPLFV